MDSSVMQLPGSKDMTESPLPVLWVWVNSHCSFDSKLFSQKIGDATSHFTRTEGRERIKTCSDGAWQK